MQRTQVKLRLTENSSILNALRRNGALRVDGSQEFLPIQYDAFEYRFYHGKELVVPQAVAEGLYRGSGVLVGDAMSDTQVPGLDVVEKWELGEQEPSRASKTVCSICGEEQGSIKALAAHLVSHAEPEDEEGK